MDQVTTGAAAIATTDFSIITLFMRADLIVKSVIIILIGKYFLDQFNNGGYHG